MEFTESARDAQKLAKEAARALGITRKTMRKYADGGFIAFHVRRVNNRRVTTGKEILRLWRGQ